MVIYVKKRDKIKNFAKKYTIIVRDFLIKYIYIIHMALPFLILDLSTRIFAKQIDSFGFYQPVPNLFTVLWIFLFISLTLSFKRKYSKIIYSTFLILSFIVFYVNNVYYGLTSNFFDFSLLEMASEGSSYIMDAIKSTNLWVYVISLIAIYTGINSYKHIPDYDTNNYKFLIRAIIVFLIGHFTIPFLLGPSNSDLSWNTWRNFKNVYINFNDNNKSMAVAGLYEYTVRNFYITFLKEEEVRDDSELEFLEDVFLSEEEHNNKYTGIFKGKNVIFLQLEGIDDWLVTEEGMPNLYKLMHEGINFTNHYSYYNGGGSTFNSEFAVNTGYLTPITYTKNAYTFNKNNFDYGMAKLFKELGYEINAFHMNSSEYYSRGINYKNWGYDNYFGLKDLGDYKDETYYLDTELIKNETFYENMFPTDTNFVDYIITYSNHIPFSQTKGVCKMLTEDTLEEGTTLTEEDCTRIQAKETDDMIGLLIQALEDNGLIDNTVIVAYTDHYLYTLTDKTILAKYKETSNNLINHTPFFIWSKGIESTSITSVTSQLNILPTVLNLFGMYEHPSYYIGTDALDPNYEGIAFFSDYSWYDGNVYVEGGIVTNNGKISAEELEEKNNYINYIIKKNDLVLKYNYFKTIEKETVTKEEDTNEET